MNYKYNSGSFTEKAAIRIQEALFRLGYSWNGRQKPDKLSSFIYVYGDDKKLMHGNTRTWYDEHTNKQLSHIKLGHVLDGLTPDGRKRHEE